jgi:hypothetical protein
VQTIIQHEISKSMLTSCFDSIVTEGLEDALVTCVQSKSSWIANKMQSFVCGGDFRSKFHHMQKPLFNERVLQGGQLP